mgnify:CR=1 FL=1
MEKLLSSNQALRITFFSNMTSFSNQGQELLLMFSGKAPVPILGITQRFEPVRWIKSLSEISRRNIVIAIPNLVLIMHSRIGFF